jgi:hypothetical protein
VAAGLTGDRLLNLAVRRSRRRRETSKHISDR